MRKPAWPGFRPLSIQPPPSARPTEPPSQTYLPMLDGLRALSIAAVLVEHFLANGGIGNTGVTIFFVISGYLITTNILSYRETLPPGVAMATFYWRRSLRIFPIFYASIVVCAIFDIADMRSDWIYDALYLSNFRLAFENAWNPSSHFWTLATEEQFYLVWFFVVFFVPTRRALAAILVACLVGAPAYRAAMFGLNASPFKDLLLPGCADSLATGAGLACLLRWRVTGPAWRLFLRCRVGLVAAALATMVLIQTTSLEHDWAGRVPLISVTNLLAVALVSLGVSDQRPWFLAWLAWPAVRHLGRISYGVYVVHYFMLSVVTPYLWRLNAVHNATLRDVLRMAALTAASVALAEVSWRIIETPAMRWKASVPFIGDGRRTC